MSVCDLMVKIQIAPQFHRPLNCIDSRLLPTEEVPRSDGGVERDWAALSESWRRSVSMSAQTVRGWAVCVCDMAVLAPV